MSDYKTFRSYDARTSMIDLQINPAVLEDPKRRSMLVEEIEGILKQFYVKRKYEDMLGESYFVLFSNELGSLTITLKTYPFGLVTLTFEDCLQNDVFTNPKFEELRRQILKLLKSKAVRPMYLSSFVWCENFPDSLSKTLAFSFDYPNRLVGSYHNGLSDASGRGQEGLFLKSAYVIPLIMRGATVPRYFSTSDERILEYDFDKIIFEADSPYQNIKILHSPMLGNCLILDDLQNLADSDLSYTRGVMNYGKISYTGKEVLILGGGDGGLLHEILKENPKFVYMVDNQMVIDASREYLRKCCGDSLDKLEGPNYKVIVDDCIKWLEKFKADGKKFDVIINDLTDIPIATSPQGDVWNFTKKILTMSFAVLKDDGSYMNHALGEGCQDMLRIYEQVLLNLPEKVKFKSHSAFVPSFMENWVFYEVKRVLPS